MEVRLALTGFGNVGQGVAQLLRDHVGEYEQRYGLQLRLTGVADRGGAVCDERGLIPDSVLDAKTDRGTVAGHPAGIAGLAGAEFLKRSCAQVLLEASSTNFEDAEPGWGYIQAALEQGMDLVLASKGALVLHHADLPQRVRERGVRLYFSGAVGAPLPVLELADRMLVGTEILGFEGIVNGTTNVILSSMGEGASYEEGVRQAQHAGIAETDPTLDVDGWDAAAKAVIIANAVLGGSLGLGDVRRTSLRTVTLQHIRDAERAGKKLKYVAKATRTPSGVDAKVGPEERPAGDVLAQLHGADMGIVFHVEPLGQVSSTVISTTSGGISTAMTMLRDVFNLARDRGWR
jgi:homoserine dehydrogenase